MENYKRKEINGYLLMVLAVLVLLLTILPLFNSCVPFDFEFDKPKTTCTKSNCTTANCTVHNHNTSSPSTPTKSDGSKLSTLEQHFTNGFKLQLEQIYTMQGSHTIPFFDEPVEALFTNNQQVVNLPGFVVYDRYELIMTGLKRNDIWTFSKMNFVTKTTWIESGYGGTYLLRSFTSNTPYNTIVSNNSYNKIDFVTSINLNGINYRDGDDYQMIIQSYNRTKGEYMRSNLVLTVVTDPRQRKDNGIIDGYVYLNTNAQVSLGYVVTQPLTGEQVRRIVESGSGYDLYQKYGYNCIRIGTNLYIPSIGNTYRYVGTTNDNGLINGYTYKYYQLKFKIIQ
jgi:hypothetical protein